MTETIDEVILSALSRNAKIDLNELWECLKESGYDLTLDEIESRIKTLEDEGVIFALYYCHKSQENKAQNNSSCNCYL